MISANGGLPVHRYTPQVTPRWPRGSEPASVMGQRHPLQFILAYWYVEDNPLLWATFSPYVVAALHATKVFFM